MDHKGFLAQILFLDIETVSLKASFGELSDREQVLFENKAPCLRKKSESLGSSYRMAGIWAEFGKIICISTATLSMCGQEEKLVIQSFYGHNELHILREFKSFLDNNFNKKCHLLCAHNGKEFDFPFLARRMLINRIPLPEILNMSGKKPWQIRHLDTMELWKFGDFKHFISLDLLAHIFDIESPEIDLKGSDIHKVYYGLHDLNRITAYCERKVVTVFKVYSRMVAAEHNLMEKAL